MNEPVIFQLDAGERHSSLWMRLRAELERLLAEKRGANDAPDKDPIQTAFIRGQIANLKRLIALGDAPPASDG